MQNDRQQTDFQIILWGKRFSYLIRFPPNTWLQSFEHCLTENHGHSSASIISIVSCVFFMGYNIYFFLSGFCVKNRTAGKAGGYFFFGSPIQKKS